MALENTTFLMNDTNTTALLNTTTNQTFISGIFQNMDFPFLSNELVVLLLFILFIYLVLKAIAFAKKLIAVAFVSALFPVILHYIQPDYFVSLDRIIQFIILGCTLFVVYCLIKPFLSLGRKMLKKKK